MPKNCKALTLYQIMTLKTKYHTHWITKLLIMKCFFYRAAPSNNKINVVRYDS